MAPIGAVFSLLSILTTGGVALTAAIMSAMSSGAGLLLYVGSSLRPSVLVREPGGSPVLRQTIRDIVLLVLGAIVGWLVGRMLNGTFPIPTS